MEIERYELELEEIVDLIKKKNVKTVCLQFPDGLKPNALQIYEMLKKKSPKTEFFIWGGTNFGYCDIPVSLEKEFDLLINFGHNEMKPDI